MAKVLKMSPRRVRSEAQLCKMERDNLDVGDFWILTNSYRVTIAEQKVGFAAKRGVTVPRKEFDQMIDWYMREQALKSGRRS